MSYLVDVDGKLVTDDTVYVEVGASGNPNACVLSLCSVNQELSEIITAWGKTPAVFSSQELGTTDYTITIGDDFVNIVEETATPAIGEYTEPSPYTVTPAFPWAINSSGSVKIKKNDGSDFTSEEIVGLVFTINGEEVTATAGSSVIWNLGSGTVLSWNRTSASNEIILSTNSPDGVTYNVTDVKSST